MADKQEQPNPFSERTASRDSLLEVENQKFWICRGTLAGYSPVFEKMFYGDFAESKQDVVELRGKKAKDIDELLRCLIPNPETGEMKPIDLSNVATILELADEYQIKDLHRRTGDMLSFKTHTLPKGDRNLIEILRIASHYRIKNGLELIVKRCGTEFSADDLDEVYKDLHGIIAACLEKYQSLMPLESKCRYEFRSDESDFYCCKCEALRSVYDFGGRDYFECVYCGTTFCAKTCVDMDHLNKAVCKKDEAIKRMEEYVRDLLQDM